MTTTPKAASFAHRARATATRLEIAYRDAKRLSQDWYANNHAAGIPFDTEPLDDGNATMPITNMDVYGMINRCDELIADFEAGNNAKLNTVLKLANPPGDWR
jgi:hypothetical protein